MTLRYDSTGIQTLAVLKCPCHGIILDGTLETCCTHQNYKKHNIKTE